MEFYWVVTLFQVHMDSHELDDLKLRAMDEFGSLGVEEYTLSEPEVDEILGERSYSGGDLPNEVLEEVDSIQAGKPSNIRIFFDNQSKAEEFQSYIQTKVLCESQLDKVETQDWNAEWRKHYSPILVNSNLEIFPSWYDSAASKAKYKVKINPGMGFGTGSHETTFLCLKIFEENFKDKKLQHILDFGSGSGILGITSLVMISDLKMDFYDIDPEANKNCFHNIELNQLEDSHFRLLLPEYKHLIDEKNDLIFANILQNILIEEASFLVEKLKNQGSMILSGLLNHQVEEVIKIYSGHGMRLKLRLTKGDWSALLLEKL